MEKLIQSVNNLKNSKIRELVDARIKEFEELGNKGDNEIFKELCFCIMTANFNAERSINIQNEVSDGFCTLPQAQLMEKLKEFGHRFPQARAEYIAGARVHKDSLKQTMKNFESEIELRKWIADNVKGIGYKEASHFMRNIGYKNVAIIDFHIIDLLVRHGLIENPRTLTVKRYLEIEKVLKNLADRLELNLAELDLYLWYLETGKILK